MRKTWLPGVAIGLALGFWLARDPVTAAVENPDFGDRVAGSYLLRVTHEGYPTIPALVMLTPDGGFVSSDASDFGAADTPRNSPVYGRWQKAGDRKISARTLYIGFDAEGEPTALTRSTGSFTFDDKFREGSGSLLIELFKPEVNPLDPKSRPFDTLRAKLTAQRITVPDVIR